jgi:stalled ribosome rescue protein Dom34
MKNQVGIWIDHKDAYLVFVGDGEAQAQHTESGVGKHVRFSGHHSAEDGSADDQRDRQFAAHLGKYYDEVISHLHEAKSILLFGPGEAKGELKKRLAVKGLGDRIVGVETVDKMTDHQITAMVRKHYQQ